MSKKPIAKLAPVAKEETENSAAGAGRKIETMMRRSAALFLLSSKKPSELLTVEGRKQMIAETDAVLGLGSALRSTH